MKSRAIDAMRSNFRHTRIRASGGKANERQHRANPLAPPQGATCYRGDATGGCPAAECRPGDRPSGMLQQRVLAAYRL